MVLQLSVTEAEAAKRQDDMNKLISTRQAAELLSSKVESGKICSTDFMK